MCYVQIKLLCYHWFTMCLNPSTQIKICNIDGYVTHYVFRRFHLMSACSLSLNDDNLVNLKADDLHG